MCISVLSTWLYMCSVCLMPIEERGGHQIPWNWCMEF